MITLYQGGLGSGKTYDAVRRIISNIKKGRRILTNIDGFDDPINNEVIKHCFDIDDYDFSQKIIYLTDEDVLRFWEIAIPNDLIVIDETQNYFGCRNWASKENNAFLQWSTSHRHNGQDLLLITPKIKMIDSQVRSMGEWIYSYRKINMFGSAIQKKYIRFAFFEEDQQPIAKKILTYDPLIFKCYKSYFSDEAQEIKIEKGANIFKHPIFLLIPVLIIALIYFLPKSSLFGGGLFASSPSEIIDTQIDQNIPVQDQEPQTGASPDDVFDPESEYLNQSVIGFVNGLKMIKTEKGIIFE